MSRAPWAQPSVRQLPVEPQWVTSAPTGQADHPWYRIEQAGPTEREQCNGWGAGATAAQGGELSSRPHIKL